MSTRLGIFIATLLIFLTGCASSPEITGAIEWRGTFSPRLQREKEVDKASPTGFSQAQIHPALHAETNRIPASVGTHFGILYWIKKNGRNTVREIVWKFPSPGIQNPKTKQIHREYRTSTDRPECDSTHFCGFGWSFDEPWEAVPGEWTVEIWVDGKAVLSTAFEVVAE